MKHLLLWGQNFLSIAQHVISYHTLHEQNQNLGFYYNRWKDREVGSGNYTKEEIKMCDSLLLDQV
jgi:hypothetical protein